MFKHGRLRFPNREVGQVAIAMRLFLTSTIDGATKGIEFYKQASGAVELFRIAHSNGKILHAEISIAGPVVMLTY
jgi:PhnB protein